jgi:hypothetical protein
MRRNIASRLVSPPVLLLILSNCVAAALLPPLARGSRESGSTNERLTLFSVATQEQFLNHADDRQRGHGNNPFGNFKAATATTKEHGNGPFPGDQALFDFNIYTGADLKKLAGTAVFVCNYNFRKHGFCDAVYQLTGGTLIAAGAVDFNAKDFGMVITGGTGRYRAATGNLVAAPAERGAQRLVIAFRRPT